MAITIDEYRKNLQNEFFQDCCIRNKKIFVFISEVSLSDAEMEEEKDNGWNPALRPKSVIVYIRNKPIGEQWSSGPLKNWQKTLTGAAEKPLNQSINIESTSASFSTLENRVFITGSGSAYEDKPLSNKPNHGKNSIIKGVITRLKTLDGYLYMCGSDRVLAKRIDRGNWQLLTNKTLQKNTEKLDLNIGFDDFDGFSEQDIYAAGGHGDVWHFDGKNWMQIDFTSKSLIQAVCCGKDNYVYISCKEGLTFRGRDNHWEKIHDGGINLGFHDMVWYEDRVWCSSDYGLWTIHDGKVATADVPDFILACSGNLYVNDDVMLLAGLGGAAFKENGEWQEIVSFPVMQAELALEDTK